MSRLIVNMITKNEASRYLEPILEHTKKFADEIVVTDDNSEDDTVAIAEQMGCAVYEVPEGVSFTINEGILRDVSWKNLDLHADANDWILALDADELLWGYTHLRGLMDQSIYEVIGITHVQVWAPGQIRVDKAWAPSMSTRLFKYHPNGEVTKRKLAGGSEPTYVQELVRQGKMFVRSPLVIEHLGYLRNEDKLAKYQRYMELDGGKYHNRAHLESIMDKHPMLQSFEGQP